MQDHIRIGIDLGGTKVEALALDRQGQELVRLRRPSARGDYSGTIDLVRKLVADTESLAGVVDGRADVGIGIPGTEIRDGGLIQNANSTWLNGRPLRRDLEASLNRPVRLENDANCLAVSEAADGAGQGFRMVLAVILGTGIGAGIAMDGAPWGGPHGIAGEWGHNPLPWADPDKGEWPGPACYCGRRGCLETWLSGTGLAADHARATGQALRGEEIVARAQGGDAAAAATLARHRNRLARGLAHVVNILDPDVIVLGGGVSRIPDLVDGLADAMGPYVFSRYFSTPIRLSQHGDSSGVRGAAWLWSAEGAR